MNPTQFGPGEDFDAYPRTFEEDLALLEEAGATAVFAPTAEDFYPYQTTKVLVEDVSEGFEGSARPTHFAGVSTVVAKLFLTSTPDRAYFGLKDLQQCAVVRRMVRDLGFGLKLSFVETVREPTGLALSSRNRYLSPENRILAAQMYITMHALATRLAAQGTLDSQAVVDAKSLLTERGFEVEYLAVVDPLSMKEPAELAPDARIVCAARYAGVRLIDNVPILENAQEA
ncbi:MAG: pantoate--beta-alanine ligase [Fimbriimonadaceae bacterium]|nr:pantoate--beta-alanine ligase [Fimbriimonadaceae bacterium]QYK57173.1 MAG: pantoate--beta-alanine ligase [Fimbriimonadaceae bacterium]